eukprot:CAMPEP_0171470032 /NCGR_PEP_ID=MMETSP0945-20130129/11679_1 /TAXON_ID=109269 /ORGANISM="Vaucheria litorea, Strain CCMP2940" /LENGTH=783 /DNA_ID=CAMNT_0011999371 /DNA_START=1 /DNA_END=2352 /DNA_ORIENTATION=+
MLEYTKGHQIYRPKKLNILPLKVAAESFKSSEDDMDTSITPIAKISSTRNTFNRNLENWTSQKIDFGSPIEKLPHFLAKEYPKILNAENSFEISNIPSSSSFKFAQIEKKGFLSLEQIQTYIQNLIERLDDIESWKSEPTEYESALKSFLKQHKDLPRLHFLLHLRHLRKNEFSASIDSLFRYFDYANCRGGPTSKTNNLRSIRAVLPYAMLRLVEIHFNFNQFEMASNVLKEAMRISQENSDSECVAHGLAWLYQILMKECDKRNDGKNSYLLAESNHHKARNIIRQCLQSAAVLNLNKLAISACFNILNGSIAMPMKEHSNKDSRDMWKLLQAAQIGNWAEVGGFCVAESISSNKFCEVEVRQIWMQRLLLMSAMFLNFGQVEAADACFLSIDSRDITKLNHLESFVGHSISKALRGENVGSCNRKEVINGCVYYDALSVLLKQNARAVHAPSKFWTFNRLLLLSQWTMNRGQLELSHSLIKVLRGLSFGFSNDLYLSLESVKVELQYCKLLMAEKKWQLAVEKAEKIEKSIDQNSRVYLKCKVQALILIADCLVSVNSTKCPHLAIKPLLTSIAICESYSLDLLHSVSNVKLSKVLMCLNQSQKAVSILKGIEPQICVNGSISEIGEFHLVHAKCLIAISSNKSHREPKKVLKMEQKRFLSEANFHLSEAYKCFQREHNFEILQEISYLGARLCSASKDTKGRNKWSKDFNLLAQFLVEEGYKNKSSIIGSKSSNTASVAAASASETDGISKKSLKKHFDIETTKLYMEQTINSVPWFTE